MAATVENRKEKRYLTHSLEVFMRETDEHLGNVLNLSHGGLLISHDDAFEIDSVREFRIPLGHIIIGLSDFEANVRVTWYYQNVKSGLFGSGFEFIENTNAQWSWTKAMIDVFAIRWV